MCLEICRRVINVHFDTSVVKPLFFFNRKRLKVKGETWVFKILKTWVLQLRGTPALKPRESVTLPYSFLSNSRNELRSSTAMRSSWAEAAPPGRVYFCIKTNALPFSWCSAGDINAAHSLFPFPDHCQVIFIVGKKPPPSLRRTPRRFDLNNDVCS